MAANDRQVGGSHYSNGQADLQHWDLVVRYDWDYFQGQVTKYLMRWKKKGTTPEARLQDLEKALHFLEKYVEVERGKLPKVRHEGMLASLGVPYQKDNHVSIPNNEVLGKEYAVPDKLIVFKTGGVVERMSLTDFEHGNPRYLSNEQFRCEGGYGNGLNLYTCLKCRHLTRHASLETAIRDHVCAPQAPQVATPAV